MSASSARAFATPGTPTLADLKAQVEADRSLSLQRRGDIGSALKRLADVLGKPMGAIPSSTSELRRLLAQAGPARLGISERRWRNICSLVLAAMRHCGVGRSYLCPFTPEWRQLYARLPDRYHRTALSRFMHFCSALGIGPNQVSQSTLDDFLAALVDETLVKNPKENHQNVCRVWNKARASVAGWPRFEAQVPRYRQTYAIDWKDCHPGLVREIRQYLDVLAHADPVEDGGPASALRPASLRSIEAYLKRYIGTLAQCGQDIASIHTLQQLVEFDRFTVAVRRLVEKQRSSAPPDTTANKAGSAAATTAWVIRCVAVKYLGCDEATAGRFDKVMAKMRTARTGLSARNDRLLVQFDDPATLRRYANAAAGLWPGAPAGDRRKVSYKLALRAQVAIAIEILMYAPMRAENLISLDFARHLRWQDGILQIEIPSHEVKNSENLQYALPRPTSERIRVYFEGYRPLLLTAPSSHLFPGRNGQAKDKSCLCAQITRAMFDATGLRITPHQFRHISAKLYLDRNPGGYEVVRRVLGHKSTSTTYQHYAGRETKAAVECFDQVVADVVADNGPRKPHSSLRRQLRQKPPAYAGPKIAGWKAARVPR